MKSFASFSTKIVVLAVGSFLTVLSGALLAHAADVTAEELTTVVTTHVKNKIEHKTDSKLGKTSKTGTKVVDDDDSVSVKVLSVPGAPFRFPDQKAITITVEASPWDGAQSNWSNRGIVRVKLSDQTGRSRDIGVPVQVSIQKPVWVVKNTVTANSPIRMNDLTLDVRDVSREISYAMGTDRELSKYIARVNLFPGEMLDARKLIVPPDVRYNDEVQIILQNDNGMVLTVPGIALSEGRIGQIIRVRQAQFQRKYYNGTVMENHQVRVDM